GPGSVAGCFVHERHARNLELPRFAGWWGHDQESRFEMGPDFKPMTGPEGRQVSPPPILALAPVLASLEIFHEAGMGRLREKSLSLTALMARLLHERLGDRLEMLTPDDPRQRGCQLSIRLTGQRNDRESRREVFDALAANDVICDWREPDVIRAAPVPLYNSHEDVWLFVDRLAACLQ
ncbi:MAG: kynureninase/PvdN C-terminal domain-containing protein, partial [Paracoccaceae bacterium]